MSDPGCRGRQPAGPREGKAGSTF
jgi:hypothetical protein